MTAIARMNLFGVALAWVAFAAPAQAAEPDYPLRPIKIVVPYSAGGSMDNLNRIIAERLSASLKQPVVVENRPGGGAVIGTEAVANAPADGYTLLACTNGAMTTNPSLYKNLRYNPARDFEPISLTSNLATVLIINADLPVRNVADLVAYAKARPNSMSASSSGNGSSLHLSLGFFNKVTGANVTHVPYRGSVPATVAVASGDVQMAFMDIVPAMPMVKAGKIRMIGVVGDQRSALAPEVPTMEEGGLAGFDLVTWSGLFAPAGTSKEIIAKLNREIRRILADSAVIKRIMELGAEPLSSSPSDLSRRVTRETPMWAALVRESGASID